MREIRRVERITEAQLREQKEREEREKQFLKIKPQNGMKIEEAHDFWDRIWASQN